MSAVGLNCHFDPFVALDTVKLMKEALAAAGLLDKPTYLMCQPLAYHTPDAGKQGFIDLPEFPFALEPRICTRWDMHRYARMAYDLGVRYDLDLLRASGNDNFDICRYIGGCCGFEPYHIRAVSEELSVERGGKVAAASDKHDLWGRGLRMHTKPWVRAR
jgi:betaine-homocysteine S-methyltransferase